MFNTEFWTNTAEDAIKVVAGVLSTQLIVDGQFQLEHASVAALMAGITVFLSALSKIRGNPASGRFNKVGE